MTPEQEMKLDALIDDSRAVRASIALIQSNAALVTEQSVQMSKRFSDHESRLSVLEEGGGGGSTKIAKLRSPSFTNEVAEAAGESMRPAVEAMTKVAARSGVLANITTGVVIGLAILAWIVLNGHH